MLLWSLVGASASILRADQNATKATSIELTEKNRPTTDPAEEGANTAAVLDQGLVSGVCVNDLGGVKKCTFSVLPTPRHASAERYRKDIKKRISAKTSHET